MCITLNCSADEPTASNIAKERTAIATGTFFRDKRAETPRNTSEIGAREDVFMQVSGRL